MIEFQGKQYRNIIEMPIDVYMEWLNSEQGQKLIEDIGNSLLKEAKTNPYFNAEECCVWSCKYNSGYDHYVEMGERTVCHKYRWNRKNRCKKIEHYFG